VEQLAAAQFSTTGPVALNYWVFFLSLLNCIAAYVGKPLELLGKITEEEHASVLQEIRRLKIAYQGKAANSSKHESFVIKCFIFRM
jgi:hypothetical protein